MYLYSITYFKVKFKFIMICFMLLILVLCFSGCALQLDKGNIVYYPFGDKIIIRQDYKLTATDRIRATYVKTEIDGKTIDDVLTVFSTDTLQNAKMKPNDRLVTCEQFFYWSDLNPIRKAGYIFSDKYVCGIFREVWTGKTWTKIIFATQVKNINTEDNVLEQATSRLYNTAITVVREQ